MTDTESVAFPIQCGYHVAQSRSPYCIGFVNEVECCLHLRGTLMVCHISATRGSFRDGIFIRLSARMMYSNENLRDSWLANHPLVIRATETVEYKFPSFIVFSLAFNCCDIPKTKKQADVLMSCCGRHSKRHTVLSHEYTFLWSIEASITVVFKQV